MKAIELTKQSFNEKIKAGVTLVDFYAPWCGPCKMQLPIVDELAREVGNQAVVAKLNIDLVPEVAEQYRVMSIPTLLVFKDGHVAEKMIGLQSKDYLMGKIKHHL